MEGWGGFMLRQAKQKNIYLMFLATATMAVMFAWKGDLRNAIFWDVNKK